MASPSDQGHEAERPNIYASASQWRHQESSAFARHAVARDAHTSDGADTKDLSSFLNQNRVEGDRPGTNGTGSFKPIVINGEQGPVDGPADSLPPPDGKEIVCGPLLNYRHMQGNTWYGSVLIVTRGGGKTQEFKPVLRIGRVEQARDAQQGLLGEGPESNGALSSEAQQAGGIHSDHGNDVVGNCLYSDPRNTFWQFPLACDIRETETKWAYSIPDARYRNTSKPAINYFFVPAASESMRIMFHSCNGFSVGTDEDAWSGPALWNDVVRRHAEAPFHVMIGGGDQIYNDGIRVDGPLRPWTDIGNPKKRRDFPFDEKMRAECDEYYLQNYIRWYSTEPFANCNGQIPQLNIWDDHDIIDGYGTYADDFMKCNVFRGIGGTAHKYYLLFQHHLAPPVSTFTSDAPQTTTATAGNDEDEAQTKDTFVAKQTLENEVGYIVGTKPGPYVAVPSLNLFARLGARIAFMGVDARTERIRHQVNFPETYDLIFDRVRRELEMAKASGQEYKHLVVLLGIPIAYPRLSWLESIFSSRLITPIKFLNRKFGVAGGIFNQFDGSVDLLDDLQDHYTERKKKTERRAFIERLQATAAEFSVRVTILGGDVHLAALGRFYSNPKLNIPVEEDHRYIVNVISSAIVNKPPPSAVANLLARRNKIHHLNVDTDETLMSLFNRDPGDATKTAKSNHVTMPSRNYTIITENSPNQRAVDEAGAADRGNGETADNAFNGKNGHAFLHKGELNAGTEHKAAAVETHGKNNDGSLDCCIRVEINQHNREGLTQPYGLTIPVLQYEAGKYPSTDRHHLRLHNSRRSTSRPGTQPSHASAP